MGDTSLSSAGALCACMASIWARRGLCAVVIVALMCLATSEATGEAEADLSARDSNPFGGTMGKVKKDAKSKIAALRKKGGVKGIKDTGRLVKGWIAKANTKYSRKAKKKLVKMQKAKLKISIKKGLSGKKGSRKKAKKAMKELKKVKKKAKKKAPNPLTKKGAKKLKKKAKKKKVKKLMKKMAKKVQKKKDTKVVKKMAKK